MVSCWQLISFSGIFRCTPSQWIYVPVKSQQQLVNCHPYAGCIPWLLSTCVIEQEDFSYRIICLDNSTVPVCVLNALPFFHLGKQDSSVNDVNKHDLENKPRENEGSLDLEDLEGSGKTDDEGDSEDNGEDSDLENEGIRTDDEDDYDEDEDDDEETGDESETDDDKSDSGPDLARGKGNIETSSEDEEENDLTDIFPKEPEVIHGWGELAKDAPRADMVRFNLGLGNQWLSKCWTRNLVSSNQQG